VVASGVSSPIGFFEGRGGTNLNDVRVPWCWCRSNSVGPGAVVPSFGFLWACLSPAGTPQSDSRSRGRRDPARGTGLGDGGIHDPEYV